MITDPKISITEIKFLPVYKNRTHIGFVSFVLNNQIVVKQIAVHIRRYPKDGLRYSLAYPENALKLAIFHPINRPTQQHIEKKINEFMEKEVCYDRT